MVSLEGRKLPVDLAKRNGHHLTTSILTEPGASGKKTSTSDQGMKDSSKLHQELSECP
jgi:hypothetical protein